jgi:peptidoglycan-associated lipoprotein
MNKSPYMLAITVTILLTLLLANTGCGKKVKVEPPLPPAKSESAAGPATPQTAPAPASTPAPASSETKQSLAPQITLYITPAAIEKGQSATLTWQSENADTVTIDNGIGTVQNFGNRTILPNDSTTYKAKAVNATGSIVAEARVTVMEPQQATTPAAVVNISDTAYLETKIKDVFFDLDQYSIREDARQILMVNAKAMSERPGIRITIEGYCDERGSEKYNLVLGDKRANAVKEFLISLGVDGGRIDTISYGEEKNFCEEHTEDCWQLNRRGHFISR